MAIDVKLQAFEGPLDLLLHLIEKNKIDIYDIPISEITDQYLAYVEAMDHEDMEVTSEFMVMAATLIDIKCRMLLPAETNEEGEEEDPRSELVKALLEYKQYKYMASVLRERLDEAGVVVPRERQFPKEVLRFRPPVDTEALLSDVSLDSLREVFEFVMRRQQDKIDPVRSKFGRIELEQITLTEKVDYVRRYARKARTFSFKKLLTKQKSKMQTIMTFLAVLELMRTGAIRISQKKLFGDIEIKSTGKEETQIEQAG